jgi:pimeloyl-ACP methyl ester carboxylesterase
MPGWLDRLMDVPRDNPAFALSLPAARVEMARMRREPVRLTRPVVVLAGYRAWSLAPRGLCRTLATLTGADRERFMAIAYPFRADFAWIAGEVSRRIDVRWPSDDPDRTLEVDVIGVSMGGLVARAAAAGHGSGKRLNIARLFTLGTPHRGALLAGRCVLDDAARSMRAGSVFLARLDEALPGAGYELMCYSRLRDTWVGATRTAPPGREVLWVSGTRALGHITLARDPRIVADIARRLRGEPPLAGGGQQPPVD